MACLGSAIQDPAVAVTKATTALLAMTALDTALLRVNFVVPASGRVLVVMQGTLHGATTFPQILFGVLQGATVIFRKRPMLGGGNLAATTLMAVETSSVVGGLTPGAALAWDAAYGVETIVALTGIKYGGPNGVVANDAFGAFSIEIWEA